MLRLASLGGRTENLTPPADRTVPSELRELEQQVGLEIGLLRSMMVELRPVALDRWGLGAALREHVDELNSRQGPVVRATIEDCQDLPHEVETAFYRIAQEALRNVVRHSHADEVQLELRREHEDLVMQVIDDGVGFDPSAVTPNEAHFGLLIMRERAEMLQGRLDFRSGPASEPPCRSSFH
jgi:signal transduction histidine kinase